MQKRQYRVRVQVLAFWSFMSVTLLAFAGCAAHPPAYSNIQPIDARTQHVTTKATAWVTDRTC